MYYCDTHCTANIITSCHPLIENGYLLFITDGQLAIGKVIAMYKSVGNRHAYVSNPVHSIDILSYIPVIAFIKITKGLFSQKCESGGNLFAHIKSSQVIYYFGIDLNFNYYNHGNFSRILSVSENSLNIYNFFAKENLNNLINIML